MIDVTAEMKDSIEWLMHKTARPGHHGKGRNSHGQTFQKFCVKRVHRIENSRMYLAYLRAREAMAANCAGGATTAVEPPVATDAFVSPSGARLDVLGANERAYPKVCSDVCSGLQQPAHA